MELKYDENVKTLTFPIRILNDDSSVAKTPGDRNGMPFSPPDNSLRVYSVFLHWLHTREADVHVEDSSDAYYCVVLAEAFEVGYAIQNMDFQIAIVDEVLRLAHEINNDSSGIFLVDKMYEDGNCDALQLLIVNL